MNKPKFETPDMTQKNIDKTNAMSFLSAVIILYEKLS